MHDTLNSLIERLDGQTRGDRRGALDALLANEASTCLLETALADTRPRVAFGAALGLLRLIGPSTRLLDPLLGAFGDPDPDTRWAASQAVQMLMYSDRRLVEKVARFATAGPEAARVMALYCLRSSEDTPERVFLHNLAHQSSTIRRAAIISLARSRIWSARCGTALTERLEIEPDHLLRKVIEVTLERRGPINS